MGEIRILLHSGSHAPFTLTDQDSGTAESPIVYAAAPSASSALVSGALTVPVDMFNADAVRPGVYVANLTKLGVSATDLGSSQPHRSQSLLPTIASNIDPDPNPNVDPDPGLPSVGDQVHLCDQRTHLKMQMFHAGLLALSLTAVSIPPLSLIRSLPHTCTRPLTLIIMRG